MAGGGLREPPASIQEISSEIPDDGISQSGIGFQLWCLLRITLFLSLPAAAQRTHRAPTDVTRAPKGRIQEIAFKMVDSKCWIHESCGAYSDYC